MIKKDIAYANMIVVALLFTTCIGCIDSRNHGVERGDSLDLYSTRGKHRIDSISTTSESGNPTSEVPEYRDSNSLPCRLLHMFPDSSDIITKDRQAILSGDDNCVLRLLDTIVAAFIKSRDRSYLVIFDSLCQVSDGYVADYMGDLSGRLFVEIPRKYIGYISRRGKNNALSSFLVDFFELRKADYESYPGERKDLQDKLHTAIAELRYSDRQFLKSIIKRSGFSEK